jgi:histone H3/H4
MSKKTPKGGIKVGSASRVMKSVLDEFRLSENAKLKAIGEAEHCLRQIGKDCKVVLDIAKRKTLKLEILVQVLDGDCKYTGLSHIARAGSDEKKRKDDRNPIAVASVLRVVKPELGGLRVSGNAADALSRIAQAILVRVALGARGVASNGRRSTIKERDVISAISITKQGYELSALHKAPVHKKKKETAKTKPKKKSRKPKAE